VVRTAILLFALLSNPFQGAPVCKSIFPATAVIPAGEPMSGVDHLHSVDGSHLALWRHGATLYWTWDEPPEWFQSPEWPAPYHYENRYKAYCRHQGRATWCATDCLTFTDTEVIYTRVYYENDLWSAFQRRWVGDG
jgi:hypothetical protein